jgi:shikimate dehydrogenase
VSSISGTTRVFPVIGWPVEQVKAPTIFNAYFAKYAIDAVCVPLRVRPEDYVSYVKTLMQATNVGGILVSIPHKPASVLVGDVVTQAASIAGAANAIYRDDSGAIVADLIDGEGFVRALERTVSDSAFNYAHSSALVVGCGGAGCAVAASLSARGIARLGLRDLNQCSVDELARRIKEHFPKIEINTQHVDEGEFDLLVNSTTLGMSPNDPLPFSVERAKASAIVADCGMKIEMTKLLQVAQSRGLRVQKGRDMMIEQSPLYMDRFGWHGTTAEQFRALGVL